MLLPNRESRLIVHYVDGSIITVPIGLLPDTISARFLALTKAVISLCNDESKPIVSFIEIRGEDE